MKAPSLLPVQTDKSKKSAFARFFFLILLGLAAIGVSLGVRNSAWARERQLRVFSTEELALAVHDSPHDALTWLYYGTALLKDDHPEAAERALTWAAKLDPKMAPVRLALGNAQMRLKNGTAAKQSYQVAVDLDPKNEKAYLALAKAAYTLGSAREAIAPLQKILELDPKNVYAWYTLGKMYGETHQSDLAYNALQRAVSLDPKQALCWRDLAQVSRHYSRFAEAEQQFQKALALDPKDAAAHYWLGQLYLEMGDSDTLRTQAQQQLEAAVQLDPGLAEAHFELGRLSERKSDWRQAAEHYERARALNPSDDQTLYHLGLCQAKLGKGAAADRIIRGAQELAAVKRDVEDMENRIRLDPQNRPLRLRLARVFRKYGNTADALVEYQTYQRLGAQDPAVTREMAAYQAELKQRAEQQAASPAAAPHP